MSQHTRLERGFLKEFCKYCDDTEVPDMFALWCAISAVGGALGRKCFLDMGWFQIHPNLYTILVGPAASKKSTAIGIAQGMLKGVEPPLNFLSQKGTPEALIEALTETPNEVVGTAVHEKSEGMSIVSEMATMIDKNSFNNGMIPLLTDLWDAPDKFEYRTRGRGKETLHNCCLNILAGSTIHWIKEAIPIVSIGGGFTSRILFVYHGRSGKLVPLPRVSEENVKRKKALIKDLNMIARISGAFKLSPQAVQLFEEDYVSFHTNSEMHEDKNLAGYAGRRHTIMLKLGMIISASMRDSRIINMKDLIVARKLLESVEETLPKIMSTITNEAHGDLCEEVMKFIEKRKVLKKSQLCTRFMGKLSKRELDVVLDTLLACKAIAQEGDILNPTIACLKWKK